MTRTKSTTDLLAESFLSMAKDFGSEAEPIRVLRARAYKILNAHVLIRAATQGSSGRYFFGLNYINAEEVANLENSSFVFICGSINNTLIIPSTILMENLSSISHDRNGEYKINFDSMHRLVLHGKNNRLDCSAYLNAWNHITNYSTNISDKSSEDSFHSVLQGRLIEIGNIRGYQTFCPNKSKKFNGKQLSEIATLRSCPELQFADYDVLRQIDVLWFREKGAKYIPECGFEVELSTGTWSGFGRLATLIDYTGTRLYVISDEIRRYQQVIGSFSDYQRRYKHIPTFLVGELYSAERGLRELRDEIGL
jgi:hypothetical protein